MSRGGRSLPTEAYRELYTPRYSTRTKPQSPPTVGAFDLPLVGCCINVEWMAHFLGATATLEWPDAWVGTAEEVQFALDQILRIQDVMNCPCGGDTRRIIAIILADFRKSILKEFLLNGLDGVAPDRPDTTFDEDSEDVGDDIIKREVGLCMACLDYVHTVLDDGTAVAASTGMDVGLLGPPIAFLLGPLAGIAWVVGTVALTTAILTAFGNEEYRLEIACCMLEGLRGKAITEENFEAALSNCSFTVPSVLDTVREFVEANLDDQGNFLSFVSALGAYFVASDIVPMACPCIDMGLVCDFVIDRCAFAVFIGPTGPEAAYVEDTGWKSGPSGVINHLIHIQSEFDEDVSFTSVRIFTVNTLNTDIRYDVWLFDEFDVELYTDAITLPKEHTNHKFIFAEETGVRKLEVQIFKTGIATSFPGHLTMVQVEADPPPFPTQVP